MPDPIGAMRQRVDIQEQIVTPDGGGGGPITWTAIDTVWAEVKPLTATTKIRALEVNISVTHKVTMRWRTDLGTLDAVRYRLLWNGAIMRIDGIDNPDAIHRFLVLTCELGQSVQA